MTEIAWWRSAVIYQVYPRSFQDSDGDGVGDLAGIAQRLDHLVRLGVDAVWISPIFPSPMRDFGYDVSDYCAIDPLFGTLADFDALLEAAHARGLRVILDFVPNHTSDQHPWFQESRASKSAPKRGWYVWRDPKPDGSPPNNWQSEFGGPAWTFDAATGQSYYHAYLTEQPDLDWRNPEVEAAMTDVLRFWFDRGVDGFRVDAIHHLHEDEEGRDNPPNPDWRPGMPPNDRWLQTRTIDQPGVHASIQAMRQIADAYPDRVMIGEAYLPIDRLMAYYGADLTGFHLPFNFHLISTDWKPAALAALIETYEAALPAGAWPNWVLGNHDRSRVASRIGPAQARVAAMLLLTLRGTPTIYQGEEIGMLDTPIPPDLVQDPYEKNLPGFGLGRDPVRTPMPWSGEPNGGFTSGRPWLPLAADAATRNVAAEAGDPRSMLSLYRALIRLRRASAALSLGDVRLLAATGAALVYERRLGGERVVVALNLTGRATSLPVGASACDVLLSTRLDDPAPPRAAIRLRADEGLVLRAPADHP
ncbi:alpha-glucosidase [Roseiarcus fermentans]|uniref:Alpha-glucosidase n=1 Tax=Roseiarcus fermentans TaxID=1473586 RepID=A0A366FSQ9_9HYPH|nr:alpha-amylase family glycosyl hydrolase [Roseiarcus fermentans]RBP17658.1 alpha-glucosidase [Roseiarcus fermentans]